MRAIWRKHFKMMHKLGAVIVVCLLFEAVVGPPVEPKKEKAEKKADKDEKPEEMDDLGLEYGRYLQQVVQALEEDKEFAKKLENVSAEQIKSGHIAKELEFVKHHVRSKLDELKRIEVDRLRKLIQQQMERVELGLYRDKEGHLQNSPDSRRWRTIPNRKPGLEGLDRKGIKIPKHLDVENPHSFEIEDLKKLIQSATSDLEELDKQRRKEFKQYELEKEAKYQESLKNMTEEQRKEAEKHHEELEKKHKDHPKVHHPGSKPQLEEVWEEQDHLPKEEFNPRTFFAMHDLNGDGHLDVQEVEALLIPEVRKMYNPNNEEDDPVEMEEEFHRMREHIFNETDKNKDSLISLEEFLKMTQDQEFQKDEGWKGLDEQQVYSDAELEEYMRQRQMEMQQHYQQYPYADQRQYYDVGNAQQGLPPHINYQVPPGGVPHQQGYPQQNPPGHPQQYNGNMHMQYQGVPPQQYQGHPQQPMQGVPPQQYQGHPQQPMQGVPPQQYQGHPQQPMHGMPPQQPMQGVPPQQYQGQPQQQMQGVPPQQYQGHPQQPMQGVPPQQYQGQPQQQMQGVPPQQHQSGVNSNQPQAPQSGQPQQPAGASSVPGQKQDASNSINQIPNAESKPNVPQQANSQQIPKTQT